LDFGVGITAANQTVGEIEHAFVVLNRRVHLVAKSVTRFVKTAQPFLVVVRHRVVTVEVVIAADADVSTPTSFAT